MSRPHTTQVLPVVEITDISSPAMANSVVEFVDQDVVQLERSSSKARRVVVRLEGGIVLYYSTHLRLRTRPTLLDDFVCYLTFGPTAAGTVNGLDLRPNIILAVPPAASISVVAEPGYESVSFFARPEDIRAHLSIRGAEQGFDQPQTVEMLHVDEKRVSQLFAWGKQLIEAATAQPELFNTSVAQRAAVQADMFDHLLTTLSSTEKFTPERSERTRQAQSSIVHLTEQYALARTEDRLYVTDLCRAAGVSERSLEYAFRAVMGLSPTAYLTRIRLHRVHQALSEAQPNETTVTAEALNWGFWHFGQFSRIYKDCFGELPSDTLRRVPSQNQPSLHQ